MEGSLEIAHFVLITGTCFIQKIYAPSASYHVSVHLAKLLQSRRFLEIDQSKTIIASGDHVC
jgi:hypothetical protein